MQDVWLVTNWQAIQWVRDPTPLSRINSFPPFQCNYPVSLEFSIYIVTLFSWADYIVSNDKMTVNYRRGKDKEAHDCGLFQDTTVAFTWRIWRKHQAPDWNPWSQNNCTDHMFVTFSTILGILKTNFQNEYFPTILIFNNTSNSLLLASPQNLSWAISIQVRY